MTVKLQPNAEPTGPLNTAEFRSQTSPEGTFWGIPKDYFTIDGNDVRLDSKLAEKLEWVTDSKHDDQVNITAVAQEIEIDDITLYINPGFWYSWVGEDDIR